MDEVRRFFKLDVGEMHKDEWLACGVLKERQIEKIVEHGRPNGELEAFSVGSLLRENEELKSRVESLERQQEAYMREMSERLESVEGQMLKRNDEGDRKSVV